VVRLRLFQNLDVKFWNYIFKTKYFLDQCEIVCEGSGTRYVITLKKFKKLKVNYPKDVKEQQTISKLLYDIDLEIKELEKKKEKYNMIKNTMMQKLLTGEIRLP
jgi:type I restriction enzyme S subunit